MEFSTMVATAFWWLLAFAVAALGLFVVLFVGGLLLRVLFMPIELLLLAFGKSPGSLSD
jgi:hypothetical protein